MRQVNVATSARGVVVDCVDERACQGLGVMLPALKAREHDSQC